MPSFTDQMGNTIKLAERPQRIISLVPSQTELLYHLGLTKEVAGITKFCVHPVHWFKNKARIGGTKDIKMDIIHQLNPDLIIANKEENEKEQVEELKRYYPVWVSDVNNLDTALRMIGDLGKITNTSDKAEALTKNIEEEFENLRNNFLKTDLELPAAYLIWRDPYMTAGVDTFIHEMMRECHLKNVFGNISRYPVITIDDLITSDCKILLLSSEPFPFRQKHVEELQEQLPETKILLVDGEMFSWYGSHLLQAPAYFEKICLQIGYRV